MYLDPGHGSWGNLPKDPVHLKKKKKTAKKVFPMGHIFCTFYSNNLVSFQSFIYVFIQ